MGVSYMNIKRLFCRGKINIARFVMLSCVFFFAFFILGLNVKAQGTVSVIGSTYAGNSNNKDKVTINGIPYIQGSGESNNDGIKFTITDMYNTFNDGVGFSAFAVWESGFSSGLDSADYDRWYVEWELCGGAHTSCTTIQTELDARDDVAKGADNKAITKIDTTNSKIWYIRMETQYYDPSDTITSVDFSNFFTAAEITYTYRIRNANYMNRADQDGFGYKRIYINYWNSSDASGDPIHPDPITVEFGLVRPISDVEGYTNNNGAYTTTAPLSCTAYKDYICVDYVDTNGGSATIQPSSYNIYIPTNTLYQHYSTTNVEVLANGVSDKDAMVDYIDSNNSVYAYNYFCEDGTLMPATITYDGNGNHVASCNGGSDKLKKYVYVEAEYKDLVDISNGAGGTTTVANDATRITVSNFENVYQTTEFRTNPYQVEMSADSRGNYVLIIYDMFGNKNDKAVIRVMDILNQAILVTFEKSNQTDDIVEVSNGWKAKENYTNQDVMLTLTMTATTIIENGFPIIEAATTDLDRSRVKMVQYWRVTGYGSGASDTDVCVGDTGGNGHVCAAKPGSGIINLYSSTSASDTNPTIHSSYVTFDSNELKMNISSNGRYRFYVELFTGNNTNDSYGEQKNPRVEVYKIDKAGPEILFGGNTNSNCGVSGCSYEETTQQYYQGTGNESGTVLDKTVSDINTANVVIDYATKDIYYVSANGQSSLLGSALGNADTADVFFTYMHALFNSEVYIRENIVYYDETSNWEYSYFKPTSLASVEMNKTTRANTFNALLTSANEDAYREYVVRYNIKYVAYNLASTSATTITGTQQNNIKIEYMDATTTNRTVCEALPSQHNIDLNGDNIVDQTDCVNFYLDHAKDFVIKITAYDLVQDASGAFVKGNESTAEITVDVVDTTAPGFNEKIKKYNVYTDGTCRMELGNLIGKDSYQTQAKLLECYGIKTTGSTPTYNFEDNALDAMGGLNVKLYILSKELKQWVALSDGYVPNRSGLYAILIVISDNSGVGQNITFTNETYHDVTISSQSVAVSGNSIGVVVSYYVDKKIVLVAPQSAEKNYGESDPVFEYSVSISNPSAIGENILTYLSAPFADMDYFTTLTTTTNGVITSETALVNLFQGNKDKVGFTGALQRQESADYNDYHTGAVSNEYVGLYKIVLGQLNITGSDGGYDLGQDYIVKIDPRVRNEEYQLRTSEGKHRENDNYAKCNLVNSQVKSDGGTVTGCYGFADDDDRYVESTATLTIKQIILYVTATGASKDYGSQDPNYLEYNNDAVVGSGAYLQGYSISGLISSLDNASVVRGVLRREIGENAGVYSICNFRGTGIADTALETKNNMLVAGRGTGANTSCSNLKDGNGDVVDVYATVTIPTEYLNGILVGSLTDSTAIALYNGFIASRALYIVPNYKVGLDKTLNIVDNSVKRDNTHANYVISYTPGTLKINPVKLIAQPTPGQRREYSYSGVDEVNPWELVVYGLKEFPLDGSGNKVEVQTSSSFTGYTEQSPAYTVGPNDSQSVDSSGSFTGLTAFYNNKSEERTTWKLVDSNTTYIGFKTNETHSVFGGRIGLDGKTPNSGLYQGMSAGWYDYSANTLSVATNGRNQCGSNNSVVLVDATSDCLNYNLTVDLNYRDEDGYKNGDINDAGDTVTVVYKSKLGYCKTTTLGSVSDVDVQCSDTQSTKILFEVYRREIILEFNSIIEKVGSIDIIYGQRYNFYANSLFAINNGNKATVENAENQITQLFYCYATYEGGVVGNYGDCTNNPYYGLTDGDSWTNIGLTFKLHDTVITNHTDDDQTPIPAGRYYVYSSISDSAKRNYKYTYLGGTLTIKTKVVDIRANSYSKEYGNINYDASSCLSDGDILNSSALLISSSCEDYGFIVVGMDSVDTIAENFIGRPRRASTLANTNYIYIDTNGLQENVGIYPINIGSIHANSSNPYNTITNGCSNQFLATSSDCIVVNSVVINNYITKNDDLSNYELTYYIYLGQTREVDNSVDYTYDGTVESVVNEGDRDFIAGTLTINPATITITVTANQTKMYGCSYNALNVTSQYYYSYANGYLCSQGDGSNFDLGYGYTVSGDKDYHIYKNGYYSSIPASYDTYSNTAINMISNGSYTGAGTAQTGIGFSTRSSALNGGVLYRVGVNDLTGDKISYSEIKVAADEAQAGNKYQRQAVGSYVITLGNLNASLTSDYGTAYNANYSAKCNASNMPTASGTEVCRNYIVDYYGNTSVSSEHEYETSGENYIFTITKRYAFVYVDYNTKIYGNDEPVVSTTCTNQDEINGFCKVGDTFVYGISRYYTKYNSLAKAPWVASIESDSGIAFSKTNISNDYQIDVLEGMVDRYGVDLATAKTKDDPVGDYHYKFDGIRFTSYAEDNYLMNHSYRAFITYDSKTDVIKIDNDSIDNAVIKDGDFEQAVYSDGGIEQTIASGETKNIVFEISLRKIAVTLLNFSKVYGIEDKAKYFEFGVCATDEQTLGYDAKGNPICSDEESEHGLSPSHKVALGLSATNDIMDQNAFRGLFGISFKRMLGENVACTGTTISYTFYGYFPNKETSKTVELGCQGGGYKVIGIIDQAVGQPGFNYEVTYIGYNNTAGEEDINQGGVMNILARGILVTPDANQGFQYGSYVNPSLIPAITYQVTLKEVAYALTTEKVISYKEDGTVVIVGRGTSGLIAETIYTTSTSGLVNNGSSPTVLCLRNIDGSNTFCINDRQDAYDELTKISVTGSGFVLNDGGTNDNGTKTPTYVFGDMYTSEINTNRSALNREIGSISGARYNRNVGEYTIVRGDLQDKSGNYNISFTDDVKYTITYASLTVTPDSNQGKVYGEADKELTFTVQTEYVVNTKQYLGYNDNIISVGGVALASLTLDANDRITVAANSRVVLKGYAYFENINSASYNYGMVKDSTKANYLAASAGITQTNVQGQSFDKYCYDFVNNSSIEGCSSRTITLDKTTKVLIGYLFVSNYAQAAGEYDIANGFVVADNEFGNGNKNYNLEVTSSVKFTISKLDIKLDIQPITKTYGQSTDAYKCDAGVTATDCAEGIGAILTATDHENKLEYNFDIYYKGSSSKIGLTGDKVLMVNSINGKYYTQSEDAEDKNNFLGISVIREAGSSCQATDIYGCEDVGTYKLVFRKVSLPTGVDNNYNLLVSDMQEVEVTRESNVNKYLIAQGSSVILVSELDIIEVDATNDKLVINKRDVQIFVNTNLNNSDANYYEIEQNVNAPDLPTINNNYNLQNYVYTMENGYHTRGANASSKSDNPDLDSTYTRVVWGSQPSQVRTNDALTGELAYCNKPDSGDSYVSAPDGAAYPIDAATLANQCTNYVYQANKNTVNANTKNKFILISRDVMDVRGLKIMPSSSSTGVANNNYESSNYNVEFYNGAIRVVGDDSAPVLVVGNKDYYIEANATKDHSTGNIYGSYSSIGSILEFLFNGDDRYLILAEVDSATGAVGNLYIHHNGVKVTINKGSLANKYGVGSQIVAGTEKTSIYPFVSNDAHMSQFGSASTYLNETNITTLQQLVTTLVKWFDVTSYDKGQYINNQYLDRKFDKYYYVAINSYGYNIANNIDNTFAINKVGTYEVSFYVMDNAGNVSDNGNIGRLHILDTTKPESGELNLYSAEVMCDSNCNSEAQWYIKDTRVRLALFNKYRKNADDTYTLDADGEYIYLVELGHETGDPYQSIASLKAANKIVRESYIDYVITNPATVKYSARGIIHYTWSSNPSGVYLTITGAQDNSYSDFASGTSQWNPYYSIDGGSYWMDYQIMNGMSAKSALRSDGTRTIKSMIMDSGVNIEETYPSIKNNSINYQVCYKDCAPIQMIESVTIDGDLIYLNGDNPAGITVEHIGVTFEYDINTTCTILDRIVECDDGIQERQVPLYGNKFTYNGLNFVISNDKVLTESLSFKADLNRERYIINGVPYYIDRSANTLTREYIATIESDTAPETVKIDGLIYTFVEVTTGEGMSMVTTVTVEKDGVVYGEYDLDNSKFTFIKDGKTYTYMYIDDAAGAKYIHTETYPIMQNDFKIGSDLYSVATVFASGATVQINGSTIVLTGHSNYTDTYRKYDQRLVGAAINYVGEPNVNSLNFRNNMTTYNGWNKSDPDSTGARNDEVTTYLTGSAPEGVKYYKDSKTAYLDTLAPEIGMNITTLDGSNNVINVKYGEEWYVYESGYYNVMDLTSDYKYKLRGKTYTIDFTNPSDMKVLTSCTQDMISNEECAILNEPVEYKVSETGLSDASMAYVYEVNYSKYYVNENKDQIKWLNSYVEKYVGAKDLRRDANDNLYDTEAGYYNLNASTKLSAIKLTEDTQEEKILIGANTISDQASGIGSNKYLNAGEANQLFDFVNIRNSGYNNGIYYQDIEYLVSYTWKENGVKKTEQADLSSAFKQCYLDYAAATGGVGQITQDCAQAAISQIITHEGNLNKDVTYTINYVVRDKAGNASQYEARGVLFATVAPSTHVVTNTIAGGVNNSPVVVSDLGNNTYSLVANQGVSLELLEEAFSVNYASSLSSYNKAAVMTIYREGELIAENVSGVSFTQYIDSSEIGNYTVVYNMNSVHTTYLGQKIPVSGETITLNISIESPVLNQDGNVHIDDIVNNESSWMLFAIIAGFLSLVLAMGIALIVKKKRI